MKKLKIKTDDVLPRLSQVVSVVNTKSPIPVLSDVVFQTSQDEGLTITSSDGETWLTIKTPCVEFDQNMTFCVIAADIFKVLSNLKGKEVVLELDDSTHLIQGTYGKGRFVLPFEDATDYPRPTMDMRDSTTMSINAENLLRALSKASLGIANEKLRPILNGIHFDFFHDTMVCASTDGQKLAKYVDHETGMENIDDFLYKGFTLPKKPVTLLISMLGNYDMPVTLQFNNSCVLASNDYFKLATRLLEGNYPNYNRVIPTDNTVETTVNKNELIEALKRVLPMGNALSELVKLSFTMGSVTISAEDSSYSKSADENVDCDYASQELAIGFNGTFLTELLQNIDGDNVKICLKEPTRAGLFKPVEEIDGNEYISLLMPIFV